MNKVHIKNFKTRYDKIYGFILDAVFVETNEAGEIVRETPAELFRVIPQRKNPEVGTVTFEITVEALEDMSERINAWISGDTECIPYMPVTFDNEEEKGA